MNIQWLKNLNPFATRYTVMQTEGDCFEVFVTAFAGTQKRIFRAGTLEEAKIVIEKDRSKLAYPKQVHSEAV